VVIAQESAHFHLATVRFFPTISCHIVFFRSFRLNKVLTFSGETDA